MNIESARQKHLTNLLALEHNVHEALKRQREDEDVRLHAKVNELVIRLERCSRGHHDALRALATTYGVEESAWKKAIGTVVGAATGLFEKTREKKLSGVLKDDYVALSLTAMHYTSVHAFATAIRDEPLAQATLTHLKAITPLMVAISKLIPEIVVEETLRDGVPGIEATASEVAVANTQRAWSRDVVESA